MLVLSRKQGEEIQISGDITVRVIRLQGRRVRIGIEAPAHVHVVRTPAALTGLQANGSADPTADDAGRVVREVVGR